MKAWHFTGDKLRDGRPVPPVGEWLVHDGEVAICFTGLHASVRLLDAMRYAPGQTLHRVECERIVTHESDKFVCRRRRIVATVDADRVDQIVRRFVRVVAYTVIDQWDAPEVVRRYLETGDESIRDAASDAAWRAVYQSAFVSLQRDAARVARSATACEEPNYLMRNTAWDAARVAASVAATDAELRGASWDDMRWAAFDAYGRELERTFLAEMGVK